MHQWVFQPPSQYGCNALLDKNMYKNGRWYGNIGKHEPEHYSFVWNIEMFQQSRKNTGNW